MDTYNHYRTYWFLFFFAIVLMAAGFLIEVFYYYIPRMESARAHAAVSIARSRKDLAYALVAVNSLPKGASQDEKAEIDRSKVFLIKAESMFDNGSYLSPDIFGKAESQADYADIAFRRIVRNGTVLGHAFDDVMASKEPEKILNAVADYCEELDSAYPKAAVPGAIIDRANRELMATADDYYRRIRAVLENNKAWERDLTANQNTTVVLMATKFQDTDFLDRMSTVCRKTLQNDDVLRAFYILYKASREGELYARVKVRPDTSTNLLEYWASDLNKVTEHNSNIESDLAEAEKMLRLARAEEYAKD